MAHNQRQYDFEYKVQAVKLAQEMGSCKKAANELGISPNTYLNPKRCMDCTYLKADI